MKQATLDLIKNIDENTFIPPSTKNELFELFQLDTVADLRKVSRNFMKLYEMLEHLDGQTSSATTEKAGIVKFGTETGNAIDAESWKQAIGQSLGGYVSKVESKEAGKWYINDLTDGKIYKCIQNHTSMSFDITKFMDITNVGLSDKLEDLYKIKEYNFNIPELTVGKILRNGKIVTLVIDSGRYFYNKPNASVVLKIPSEFAPRSLVVFNCTSLTGVNNNFRIDTTGDLIKTSSDSIQGAYYFTISYICD